MSDNERRYAHIEKEALATVWACEKFAEFIIGKHIHIETDHKPLVPLLGSKDLAHLPPRNLRFSLRMDRFSYTISHVPGKNLYTADALSRAPIARQSTNDISLQELAELCTVAVVAHLPVSNQPLNAYKQAQESDPTCQQLLKYCQEGWPARHLIDPTTRPFWHARGSLTIGDGLLLYDQRMVVPPSLQAETLRKIHERHQGIVRCRLRSKTSVWWPGISHQLTSLMEKCPECAKAARPVREPLIPSSLPEYPWQKVATDLFHLDGSIYMIVVDYFSRYPEVKKLTSTTTQGVINVLKSLFARYGIPEVVRSDNGPQFSSQEFTDFAREYQFHHQTSSPHFPSSNGQAERAVQTVKNLLKKSKDPFVALLAYRATPLPWCGLSPAELLMGRNIRTTLPLSKNNLISRWPYLESFRGDHKNYKKQQKRDFDRRHRTRDLPDLLDNTNVWITSGGKLIHGYSCHHR